MTLTSPSLLAWEKLISPSAQPEVYHTLVLLLFRVVDLSYFLGTKPTQL